MTHSTLTPHDNLKPHQVQYVQRLLQWQSWLAAIKVGDEPIARASEARQVDLQ